MIIQTVVDAADLQAFPDGETEIKRRIKRAPSFLISLLITTKWQHLLLPLDGADFTLTERSATNKINATVISKQQQAAQRLRLRQDCPLTVFHSRPLHFCGRLHG
ncbi:hypothetical protein MHYP_G00084510 [Metynnis hypsauchen]